MSNIVPTTKPRRRSPECSSFHHFFTLALALTWDGMVERMFFPQSQDSWSVAVKEIHKKFGKTIPQLKNIFFVESPSFPLYSEEVSEWRRYLRMGQLITTYLMPLNHDYYMTSWQRAAIIKKEKWLLRDWDTEVKEMAVILKRHLQPSEISSIGR